MSGSTLDAMAAAVEGASCVLLCMSASYKASANCRLEGNCEPNCDALTVYTAGRTCKRVGAHGGVHTRGT